MSKRSIPKIFVSSTFKDIAFDGETELALRRRIIEEAAAQPVTCWAYEVQFRDRIDDTDTILDRCFDGIRGCDLFVFLQTGQHGSGARYLDDSVLSTYLELELFAAAMLQKRMLILHLRGRDPPSALHDAMVLLKRSFEGVIYHEGDERELCEQFRLACQRLVGRAPDSSDELSTRLPEWLSIRRTQATVPRDLEAPALLFLGGHGGRAGKRSDIDRATRLLGQVTSGVRDGPVEQRAMSHGAALFRIWSAIRELMDESGSTQADPVTAPLWDRAWGLWASNASWFGLHGHLQMGPLAAVNSQGLLRREFAADKSFHPPADVREPLGAKASALYSVAQRVHSRARQVFHYEQVERLATQAIRYDKANTQGVLSVRAHAAMRLARLGRLWKVWDAERDLRKSLKIRERVGGSPAQIGESKTDLGFLFAHTFRSKRGFELMEEGVKLMRTDKGASSTPFLMRGLRKLEQAALRHGRTNQAEDARREIAALARTSEAFDQERHPN